MPTQAEVRASLLDQLDSIGQSAANFSEETLFTAGEEALFAFIERVKANIQGKNMVVTGGIEEMSAQIREDGLYLVGNEWLLYQDRGVQGSESSALAPNSPHKYTDKAPPSEVFIEYIKRKNINLANQAQFFKGESHFKDLTEEQQIKTVAYLMQQKVFKLGFKPRNIFAKEIPQLKTDLAADIKNAAVLTIKEVFYSKDKK